MRRTEGYPTGWRRVALLLAPSPAPARGFDVSSTWRRRLAYFTVTAVLTGGLYLVGLLLLGEPLEDAVRGAVVFVPVFGLLMAGFWTVRWRLRPPERHPDPGRGPEDS